MSSIRLRYTMQQFNNKSPGRQREKRLADCLHTVCWMTAKGAMLWHIWHMLAFSYAQQLSRFERFLTKVLIKEKSSMVCKLVRQQAPFEISLGMFNLTEYQHPRKSIYLPLLPKKMSIDSLIQQFTTLNTGYWIQNCNLKKILSKPEMHKIWQI